jgi:Cof subfamily protein (haloacid dehalogenase superfamily)
MGKFDGILLASDFDGTLFCNQAVSRENADAIRYFQSEGGRFTLATGRDGAFVRSLEAYFRVNAPVICINGSMLYDLETERVLMERAMEADYVKNLITEIFDRWNDPLAVWVYVHDKIQTYKNREKDRLTLQSLTGSITKLVFEVRPEDSDRAVAFLREMAGPPHDVHRSCIQLVELMPTGAGKGDAIRELVRLSDGAIRKTVCVGDYENDITMLQAADIGYAVENAVPCVKAVADRITVDYRDHAIAAIVRDLEEDARCGRL